MHPGAVLKQIKAAGFKDKRAVKSEPLCLSTSFSRDRAVVLNCHILMSLGVLEVTGGQSGVHHRLWDSQHMHAQLFPDQMFVDVVGHCEVIFPQQKSEI